jgi:integrase
LKEVEPFAVEEIKQLLGEASERTRLYVLLMLNCGMYPVDIALLRQDEVDWITGRIIRKRTKTRDRSSNVPKVDYLLWQETFALLREHRSKNPELVLVNAKGAPLWQYKEKNGKVSKITNIQSAYIELMKNSKLPEEQRKPLKALRKTPSSMLENHAEYGRYAEYFLGEAPKTVASRHYIKPSRKQFDKAIKWLGQQFGIK